MPHPQIDLILAALEIDAGSGLMVLDARSAVGLHVPRFPPDLPALLLDLQDVETAAAVKAILAAVYPPGHRLRLVYVSDEPGPRVTEQVLDDLLFTPLPQALFIPPLAEGSSFERFQEIIAHLRAPNGCPWDREQTHLSLRKHLLEESYESLAAMDAENPLMMREEFGDLLLQIVLNAQIASESGEFRMSEVLKDIHDKIIRRHPHVFGDLELSGVGEVLQNWERLKAAERSQSGNHTKSLMDSLPSALPALTQAQEFLARAARVGFTWNDLDDVLNKIQEEIAEVREAKDEGELNNELGDLLFALVNLARWKGIDAEASLREANARFKSRFAYIEQVARQQTRTVSDFSEDELIGLWQEAKSQNS